MTNERDRFILYRFWDSEGNLLYVGQSNQPDLRRIWQHRAKPWWCEVGVITIDHFETWWEVARAEADAIFDEQPKHNKVGKQARIAYTTPASAIRALEEDMAALLERVREVKAWWDSGELQVDYYENLRTALKRRRDQIQDDMAFWQKALEREESP